MLPSNLIFKKVNKQKSINLPFKIYKITKILFQHPIKETITVLKIKTDFQYLRVQLIGTIFSHIFVLTQATKTATGARATE